MGTQNVKVKEPVEVKQLKVGGPPEGAKPCLKLRLSGPKALRRSKRPGVEQEDPIFAYSVLLSHLRHKILPYDYVMFTV